MPFLSLNGVTVSLDSWEETKDRSNPSIARAFDGTPIKTERFKKRSWTGRTNLISLQEALAWQAIVDAEGYSFTADGSAAYDGKGLALTGTYTTSSGGKHGDMLEVASGDAATLAVGSHDRWTILHWRDSWTHYAWDDADNKYSNGSTTATDPDNWLNYASGDLDLLGKNTSGTNADTDYDEIYFIPARLTETQISEWYTANNTTAFPEFPRLLLDGDCVNNLAVNVVGQVSKAVPTTVQAGGTVQEYWQVTFDLFEV